MISRFSICTLFLSFRLFAFRVHSEQFYLLSSFEEFAPNFNNKLFAAHKENTNYLSLEVVLLVAKIIFFVQASKNACLYLV